MNVHKSQKFVFSEERSDIAAKNVENDNIVKNYFDHMKSIFKDTEKISTIILISVSAVSLFLLLVLLFYFICKKMKLCGRRKPKKYSLLATSETDLKSFFNPTLSAYEDGEDILRVDDKKEKIITFQTL
ncbi:unnamed protein product [Hymenolepis diminuta]|uniref:Uncharacterized protein n=1 Tax=Hymenolepis diminuta TaxID=6216 RepID=A0A564YRR2_HYMDI|nr:unnamed protein product [Hymenolepis diminuta]